MARFRESLARLLFSFSVTAKVSWFPAEAPTLCTTFGRSAPSHYPSALSATIKKDNNCSITFRISASISVELPSQSHIERRRKCESLPVPFTLSDNKSYGSTPARLLKTTNFEAPCRENSNPH